MVFLPTVVLCCIMAEGLNPGPALSCVEFAGAPSMCSSVSSHSLKTSVHSCWRLRSLLVSVFDRLSSAPASNTPPERDGEANLSSISQFRMLWLPIIHWKLAFYPSCAVENPIKRLCSSDVQDGVLIRPVCDRPRYSVTNTQSCLC